MAKAKTQITPSANEDIEIHCWWEWKMTAITTEEESFVAQLAYKLTTSVLISYNHHY